MVLMRRSVFESRKKIQSRSSRSGVSLARFRSVRRSSEISSLGLVSRPAFPPNRTNEDPRDSFYFCFRQVLEVAPEPSGLAHKQRGGHRLAPSPPLPLPEHLRAARHPGVRGQVHQPRRSNPAEAQKQL